VICAGGGGIPVVRTAEGDMMGVEAVIDKDRTSALLALCVEADALLLLTDVPAVFRHYGSEDQIAIGEATPDDFEDIGLAPGSMGPKVGAALTFVRASGKLAGIGQLTDARAILEGRAGTRVMPDQAMSRQNTRSGPKTSGFTGADQPVSVWLDDGGAIV
jgi:carbamate kinase